MSGSPSGGCGETNTPAEAATDRPSGAVVPSSGSQSADCLNTIHRDEVKKKGESCGETSTPAEAATDRPSGSVISSSGSQSAVCLNTIHRDEVKKKSEKKEDGAQDGSPSGPGSGNDKKRKKKKTKGKKPGVKDTRSCCFCWCCCCSCSCLSVKNSTKETQMATFNDPFASGSGAGGSAGNTEPPPTLEEIRAWGQSFDKLMRCSAGQKVFREFLRCEYSEENLLFWLACEDLKNETDEAVVAEKARIIYEDYVSVLSPNEVSLDAQVREVVNRNMARPSANAFDEAQLQIYTLMHRDSYPRFLASSLYRQMARLSPPPSARSKSSQPQPPPQD